MVRVAPRETDAVLANPGMGWQTFHCFADEDANLAGLPSTSVYFRLYWREIEPVEGGVAFDRLDGLLARARAAGQKLALRVMCAGTGREPIYVPEWLRANGCPGFEYEYQRKRRTYWVPDMDSAAFQEPHLRLIRELGARYDGHPGLDLVDIGSVGLWGEWHMSGTGVELPSVETRLAIIDAYCEAFVKTRKVMLIGDEEGMRHALARGCGWRADCLGDMGGFSETWNHMEHCYPQQIAKTRAEEAWQKAPVAFESCWDMRKWRREGWDVRAIFDYALEYHVSYVNNKSAPIPEGMRAEVERLLRRMGYRLVLRRVEHRQKASAGAVLSLSMVWENFGVAPPYGDYVLALRLTDRQGGRAVTQVTDTAVKGWLPGEVRVAPALQVPRDLRPGGYELAVGVVDPDTREPAVRLAMGGGTEDGWYPVSEIEVATG